jgi:hypothetical protein
VRDGDVACRRLSHGDLSIGQRLDQRRARRMRVDHNRLHRPCLAQPQHRRRTASAVSLGLGMCSIIAHLCVQRTQPWQDQRLWHSPPCNAATGHSTRQSGHAGLLSSMLVRPSAYAADAGSHPAPNGTSTTPKTAPATSACHTPHATAKPEPGSEPAAAGANHAQRSREADGDFPLIRVATRIPVARFCVYRATNWVILKARAGS